MNQSDLNAPAWQLSERARKLTSSAIREILKVTERPEVISFAGGLPSPATFPAEEMRAASDRILRDSPAAALQWTALSLTVTRGRTIAGIRWCGSGIPIRQRRCWNRSATIPTVMPSAV